MRHERSQAWRTGHARQDDVPGYSERSPGEFGFAETAASLGIPVEAWEDHRLRVHVRLINNARRLQEELADAEAERWRDASPVQDGDEEPGGHDAVFHDRYERAELLLRAVIHILEEGFDGRMVGPEYVAAKIGSAIGRYGLAVVRRPVER
jgi:hypothetical protein